MRSDRYIFKISLAKNNFRYLNYKKINYHLLVTGRWVAFDLKL